MHKTVAVLRGGPSDEHAVSLKTGAQVIARLGERYRVRNVFTVLFIVMALLACGTFWASTRTFSSTSSWDPALLARAHQPIPAFPDWQSRIAIPPPPPNVSLATARDFVTLFKDKWFSRTPERLAEINAEIDLFQGAMMGGRPIGDYFDPTKFPATATYLGPPFADISVAVLAIKEEYDRVRPNALFPFLDTTIDVPRHPSYPSGHATQSYFIAYMLGRAVPERVEEFLADAHRIAEGREVAGVHYPSDSEAGRMLAEQWVALELSDPARAAPMGAARAELLAHP